MQIEGNTYEKYSLKYILNKVLLYVMGITHFLDLVFMDLQVNKQ